MKKQKYICRMFARKTTVVYLPADDQFTLLHYDFKWVVSEFKKNKKDFDFDVKLERFKYGWEFPDGSAFGLNKKPRFKRIYAEEIGDW